MEIVIYTSIAGEYDKIRNPQYIHRDVKYVCYTDYDIKSNIWDIRPLPDETKYLDNNRKAKYTKILPHRLFPEYDVSLWVDGNLSVKSNIENFINNILTNDLVFLKHPNNRKSLKDEVNACLYMNKDNDSLILAQYNWYKQYNIEISDMFPCCGIILRRHNQEHIKKAMEDWWLEILKWSKRDQISFPYIATQNNLNYSVVNEDFHKYFNKTEHKECM